MQGMEKDLMVMSTAVTCPGPFAADRQRLNVALTRARHHLLVVGHAPVLQAMGGDLADVVDRSMGSRLHAPQTPAGA